jgi:hypothetical protein
MFASDRYTDDSVNAGISAAPEPKTILNNRVEEANIPLLEKNIKGVVMKRLYVTRKAVEVGVMLAAVSTLVLVGCGGGGGSSAPAATTPNGFVAALTDGVGLRGLSLATNPVVATVVTGVPGASGSYTMRLDQKTWSGSVWHSFSATPSGYNLYPSGAWVDDTVPATFTPGAADTIVIEGDAETWLAVDLAGATIKTGTTYNLVDPAITGGSAVISVGAMDNVTSTTAIYPAGSKAWIGINLTYGLDYYEVYNITTPIQTPTPTGNLTSLNFADANSYTSSNPLCYSGYTLVYSASPAANTARFDVYPSATCVAIPGGATRVGTVDMTYKTVRTQSIAEFSNYSGGTAGFGPFSHTSGTVVMPRFFALINGVVYSGLKWPAGTKENVLMANGYMKPTDLLNKTAMDAVVAAVGLSSF